MTRLRSTLFLGVLLTACSPSGSTKATGLITNRGTFPSPSASFQLVIGSKSQSLVDYKIVNATTKEAFVPDTLFSDAMRWAAYWQDDDTLWVCSSDIGTSVWKRDSNGRFSQKWLGQESDLVPTIPSEVWEFLPSSLQRQWEPLRRQPTKLHGAATGDRPIRAE